MFFKKNSTTGVLFYRKAEYILLFNESFEYPDWFGTYDTGSIIIPEFTDSVLFSETFDSGSWQ